jgi:hypothetical protein
VRDAASQVEGSTTQVLRARPSRRDLNANSSQARRAWQGVQASAGTEEEASASAVRGVTITDLALIGIALIVLWAKLDGWG